MIRFSAALVVVAIGVLIGGVATSKLTLVYLAIGISAAALILLAIGVALKREELFGEGQVLSPVGAGDSPVSPASGQNGPVAPQVTSFPGSAAAPAAQSGRGTGSGLSDAAYGAAGGGWDRTGHDRVGQPSAGQPAYGQSAHGRPAFGQHPARTPWSAADTAPGRPGAESTAQQAGDQAAPPWAASGAGRDARSDRERDSRPPWDVTGSGQDRWSDRDRMAGQVIGWQSGTPSGAPGGSDTSSSGGPRDNAERPPLPGRHSRNVGADDPWSPPTRAESGPTPEPPSPFSSASSSAPRRVPGATLGNWFDQQDESDLRSQSAAGAGQSAAGAAEEPAAADKTAADDVAADSLATDSLATDSGAPTGKAASPAGTATGSAWSGSDWAWSSPLTGNAATSTSTGASDDAAVSGDTAASGADDDDWPSRYSWLKDDETAKSEDPDDLPSASTTSPESPAVRPARDAGDDVKTTSDRKPSADGPLGTFTDMTGTDINTDASEPATPATAAATELAGLSEPSEVGAADLSDGAGEFDGAGEIDGTDETAGSDAYRESGEGAGTNDAGDVPAAETADDFGLVTILPGVPRYHEGNCILIRFMSESDVQHLTIPEAEKLGCTPCTACRAED